MFSGTIWAAAYIESATTAAILGGGLLMISGLVGLYRALTAGQNAGAGRRLRDRLSTVGWIVVTAGGLSLLVGVGVVRPLFVLKSSLTKSVAALRQDAEAARSNKEILARLAQVQAEQRDIMGSLLSRISRAQTEQLTREILSEPRRKDPRELNQFEFKVSSQNGEDGIIAEIFRRIGATNRTFVDFGCSTGAENNTAFLVRQGWNGLWMDASTEAINAARGSFAPEIAAGRLKVVETFITAENIESLLGQGGIPEEFDLLSVDIDRNDYYVWEKIANYRPRVVVIEYNGMIPPSVSWVIPYDPKGFGWNAYGNGNGASLKALEGLGKKKGYSLVGCDLAGVNAFFVRDDLLGDQFVSPYTAETHYEPFRWLMMTH